MDRTDNKSRQTHCLICLPSTSILPWTTSQRRVPLLDVMRSAASNIAEQMAETVPHVLDTSLELVFDGRDLQRPVVPVGPCRAARGFGDRSGAPASLHRGGSTRRAWTGHRRFQGRQRNRRCDESGASLLFHWLYAGSLPGQTIGDIARAEQRSWRRSLRCIPTPTASLA